MYVDLQLGAAGAREGGTGVTVPASAVQTIGDRAVVYVKAEAPGQFTERTVTLGAATGQQVQVTAGLSPGESVVVAGSFFLRAEAERLGLRPAAATEQAFQVTVTAAGFEPSTLTMKAGVPAKVTFRRTADPSCATEVVFPSLKIRRALPLDQPVEVRFTPTSGRMPSPAAWTCSAGPSSPDDAIPALSESWLNGPPHAAPHSFTIPSPRSVPGEGRLR